MFLDDQELRLLTLPSERRLRALANELAKLPSPDAGPVQSIEIQVWATEFDRSNLAPSGFMLRSLTVEFNAR
jgi:hypothetical protein